MNEGQSDFKISMDHFKNKSKIEIGTNKLEVNVRMARVLGLLNLENKVPKLIQDIYSSRCNFTVLKTGNKLKGVRLDATSGNGEGIELARTYDFPIWALVSPSSFQFVLVDCDFVMEEMVGKERTQNIEVVPFDYSKDHIHYSPERLTWKKINSNVFYSCFIRFADKRGRRFEKARITAVLTIRQRPLT